MPKLRGLLKQKNLKKYVRSLAKAAIFSGWHYAAGIGLFFLPLPSEAFPELIRYGYSNCMSCHVSPTGMGIMNQYGREISRDVLSTWGREGEERFAFGTPPSWLALGGDLRTLNLRQETSAGTKIDQLILMQADLEAAASVGQWTADATIGRLDTAIYPQGSSWTSRRHYLLYRPADQYTLRAGKFEVPYGIMMADHYAYSRKTLGFDVGTETYNIEAGWLTEKYGFFASGSIGRPDDNTLLRDSGIDITGSIMLADSVKTGLSYHYGTHEIANRHLLGSWGIFGINSRLCILAEFDLQRNYAYNFTAPQWGLVHYLRADVEPVQGLHFFATEEISRLDFNDQRNRHLRYGLGAQWFPRPHYEIAAMWQEQQLAVSEDFQQILWLMLHFYP